MPKHARKKQKTSKTTEFSDPILKKAARLEKLLDEESKDDEERRLESLLFGVKYVREKNKQALNLPSVSEGDDDLDDGGRELEHLHDQDLFFVDDGTQCRPTIFLNEDLLDDEEEHSSSENSSDESESGSQPSTSKNTFRKKPVPTLNNLSQKKPPVWVDPADIESTGRISLLSGSTRLRKLRQNVDEDEITSREYETRLRAQFERINPEPAWAKKSRKKIKGAQDTGELDNDVEEDEEGFRNLLSSTGGLLAQKGRKSVLLPTGSLAVERVRDANHSVQDSSSGQVKILSFHPKPAVPVLCVATADRRVRLFHIDGHLSPLLTTLHLPSLPLISSSSVLFHPQGNSMLITGPRPFFYTYDLQQGTSTLHRRGLWGTGFEDSSATHRSGSLKRGKGSGGKNEQIFHSAFSPTTGSILALAGHGGNVHLVDWNSGSGQVVGSLKCTSSGGGGGGGVQGLWWVPSSATEGILGDKGGVQDEKHLAVMTGEAEIYIWDVGQRRCIRKWKDEGGYRGAGRVFTGGGGVNGHMAIGSASGFVNVYGSDSFSSPQPNEAAASQPKLARALGHLTTPISTLRFNHDAQILAMASKEKKDALRLIHVPSLTAFGNWPTSSTPLGHVTAVDFSARSEYIAIGNTRGRVLLYHLKDFGISGRDFMNR